MADNPTFTIKLEDGSTKAAGGSRSPTQPGDKPAGERQAGAPEAALERAAVAMQNASELIGRNAGIGGSAGRPRSLDWQTGPPPVRRMVAGTPATEAGADRSSTGTSLAQNLVTTLQARGASLLGRPVTAAMGGTTSGGIGGSGASVAGAAALALGMFTAAVHVTTKVLTASAHEIENQTRVMVHSFRGEFVEARIADRQRQSQKMSDYAGIIPILGPMVAGLVNSARNISNAKDARFTQMDQETKDRASQLSRYDPRIARQQALSEVSQQQRDMTEAGALGGRYSKLMESQRELENLKAQNKMAANYAALAEQTAETQKELAEQRKKLGEALEKLPADIGREISKIGKIDNTFDKLLHGMQLPDLPDQRRQQREMPENRLNIPLLRR